MISTNVLQIINRLKDKPIIVYYIMANQGNKTTTAQLYGEAGLIYIRYRATIGNKGKGQKKIVGDLPSYSKILTQLKYTKEVFKSYF